MKALEMESRMADPNTAAATEKPERKAKIDRIYTLTDGTTAKRLKTGVKPIGFALIWNTTGERLDVELSKVPEATRDHALAFGLVTNITNAAGSKEATFADMADRHEIIMSGEWAEAAGEGGPSPTLLAEAYHKAFAAKGRTTFSDGTAFELAGVILRVKAMDADTRKNVRNDPFVKAAYIELELERTKARLKDAKAAIKEATGVGAENMM